jgi:HAD superfamily hydrolase (TIGR01509 family)
MWSDGETERREGRRVKAPTEVVVLDLGGVVCNYVPDQRLRALADLTGLRTAAIDEALFASGLDEAAELGELSLDEAYDAVATALGLRPAGDDEDDDEDDDAVAAHGLGPARDELRRAWARAFVPDADLLALVRPVRRTTALFTNNGPLIEDCLANELSAVTTAFDLLVVSWRLGVTKPHPEAYTRAAAALGTEPDAILFVDDTPACVAAAVDAGWDAHPYRGTNALARLLEEYHLFTDERRAAG